MLKKNLYLKMLIIIFITLIFQSCSLVPKREDFLSFKPVPIEKADPFPSKFQLKKNNKVVIISKFDINELQYSNQSYRLAQESNLSSSMTGTLEKYLRGAGVKLFDGNERQKRVLIEAAQRNEILTDNNSKNIIVDYVFFPRINSLDVYSEYEEAYETTNILTGKKMNVPAKCKYTANISSTLRIYDGTTRQMEESIDLSNEYTDRIKARNSYCNNKQFTLRTIRKAGQKTVTKNRTIIQNYVTPITYIEEMKKDSSRYIVKINCGKKCKIEPKDKVDFYTFRDPEIKGYLIGHGRVSHIIGSDYAWVLIDNPEQTIPKIKQGYVATIKFKKGFFESFTNIIDDLN